MKERQTITRAFPLIDLEISRAAGGVRIVTAYAATFDDPYPVRDQFGDYDEEIDRAAFNRAISHGIERVGVFYNHGRTLWGTPSEQFSKPLGSPVSIVAEARGLLTRTRYNATPLAEEVLAMIENGDVRGQSFSGTVFRSSKTARGGRTVLRRLELGLKEYGPAPSALLVNPRAEIVAFRSQALAELGLAPHVIEALTDEQVEAILAVLDTGTSPRVDPGTGNQPPADLDTQPQPAAVAAPADTGPSPVMHDIELAEAANAQRRRRL